MKLRFASYIIGGAVLSGMLLCGCEKELDLHYKDIDPLPVIEASASQDGTEVTITMTTPMDEPFSGATVTDASVVITDLTDGTVENLLPDTDGIFRSGTPATVGHDYQLTVNRDGETYTSTGTMLPPVSISSVEFQWIKMPYDYVAMLQVSFSDNQDADDECYWLRVYRNGEAYLWTAVNSLLTVDGQIDVVLMTSRQDTEEEDEDRVLRDGDVIEVSVCPITRAMHDYLEAISNGTSNGPQMFAGDYCLGYFLVSPVTRASTVFHPDQLTEYK